MIGYIYKIQSNCGKVLYIGSTIQKLKKRFNHHKTKKGYTCAITKYLNDPDYIFSNGCELIKEYEVVDRNHLYAYEQLFLNRFKHCINGQDALRLLKKEKGKQYNKEYRQNNRKEIKQKSKEYKENNKDKINAKVLCECGISGTHTNIARHAKTNKHKSYLESKEQLIEALSFM